MYKTEDSKRSQKIKSVALDFASIFTMIFNDPPECVLVDDFYFKVIILFSLYKLQIFTMFNVSFITGFLE